MARATRPLDEGKHPPTVATHSFAIESPTILGRHKPQARHPATTQVLGDALQVLHQGSNVAEDLAIDLLQQEPSSAHRGDDDTLIDVAKLEGVEPHRSTSGTLAAECETINNLRQMARL